VLDPGCWWPLALVPIYWALEARPATRESARLLGLVTVEQMIAAMAAAVERPATGVRILEVDRYPAKPVLTEPVFTDALAKLVRAAGISG